MVLQNVYLFSYLQVQENIKLVYSYDCHPVVGSAFEKTVQRILTNQLSFVMLMQSKEPKSVFFLTEEK